MLNDSLDYLHSDTSSLVCSHLNVNGLIALNSTSKHWKKISDEFLKILKPQFFEDRFGALASHEVGISYDTLATRIHFTMKLGCEEVKKNLLNGKFQVIFENQIPYIKLADKNSQNAEAFAKTNAELKKIYAEQINILNDLYIRPINIKQPLQDYRNRLIRHKTILKERALLSEAVIRSEVTTLLPKWNYFNFLGLIVEAICKIFMELFYFIYPEKLSEPAEITYGLSNYLDPAAPHPKKGIEVGSGKITLLGNENEYKISATASIVVTEGLLNKSLRNISYSKQIVEGAAPEQINILLTISNNTLVYFTLRRCYDLERNKSYLSIGVAGNPLINNINVRSILRPDVQQLIMEIFNKDPMKHLRISVYDNPYAYLLAGFQSEVDLPLGLDEVRNFYIQNGKLPEHLPERFSFNISKNNILLEASKTQFVWIKNEVIQPSYVTLEPTTPPTTWEALFNKKSYLNAECESVMWKFYEQNPNLPKQINQ